MISHCVLLMYVVSITTQPMDDIVCLTQSTTVNFTCVVEDKGGLGIASGGWQILVGSTYVLIPTTGRARHMTNASRNGDTITDTLTVTSVSVNDNGAQYRCQPIANVISDVATITVLGMCVYDHYSLYN